ncbi:cold shock domain-containing protein [candidate division KSB1 bacterium]|nr:cold shock domain-containing protein [candidate division KSB1 bacterium]
MKMGLVKSWDAGRGYGFVVSDEGGDLFLHVSDLDVSLSPNELRPGLRVRFDVRSDMRGDKAIRVRKA